MNSDAKPSSSLPGRIAEIHGEKVWLEPNESQGNVLYMEIPRRK